MIHVPNIPLIPMIWSESWTRGSVLTPDIWTATKKYMSGVVVHEVEVSNACFFPGGVARPQVYEPVTVAAPRGYTLVSDCDRLLPMDWYSMHASMRRYAMYPTHRPDLVNEALARAAMQYDATKWRRGKARYGPCSIPMPNLTPTQQVNESAKVSGWLSRLKQILATPGMTGSVEDSEDGIFSRPGNWTPWGPLERGRQGGSGIFFYTGWEGAPEFPAYAWLVACCNHERRWHAYHANTGEPITVYNYPDPGPMYQEGSQTANNRWLPEFSTVAQWPDPIYLPYDFSHSIRGFRHLVALSEMVDSRAVLRMLKSQAAQFRLQMSDRGPWPQPSGYTPPSLRTWTSRAKASPGSGFFGQDTGRMLGWPAYLIAQSVKKGALENKAWTKMFCEFAQAAVMPNGIVSRCHGSGPGDVWFDPVHDTAQAFEVPIFWHGAVGCAKTSDRIGFFEAEVNRFATSLYIEAPLYPYYGGLGPPHFAYVAQRNGVPYGTVPGGIVTGGGDSTHTHAGCALAASLDTSKRDVWINRAKAINPIHDMRESAGIVAQDQLA